MTSPTPRLLVFIGPSGAGKSAVVRALSDRGVIRVHPTWTTRPRRGDELDRPVEHHFVTEAEFLRRRAAGFFLHTVQMFGLPHWYGLPTIEWSGGNPVDRVVPVDNLGPVDAVMMRATLVPILRSVYPDLVIYQIDAAPELVESRLAARGSAAVELDARRFDNEGELVAGRAVAHRNFHNDDSLDVLVAEISRAIRNDFAPELLEAM